MRRLLLINIGAQNAVLVHDATSTLEDCVYFFISNGRVRIEADAAACSRCHGAQGQGRREEAKQVEKEIEGTHRARGLVRRGAPNA